MAHSVSGSSGVLGAVSYTTPYSLHTVITAIQAVTSSVFNSVLYNGQKSIAFAAKPLKAFEMLGSQKTLFWVGLTTLSVVCAVIGFFISQRFFPRVISPSPDARPVDNDSAGLKILQQSLASAQRDLQAQQQENQKLLGQLDAKQGIEAVAHNAQQANQQLQDKSQQLEQQCCVLTEKLNERSNATQALYSQIRQLTEEKTCLDQALSQEMLKFEAQQSLLINTDQLVVQSELKSVELEEEKKKLTQGLLQTQELYSRAQTRMNELEKTVALLQHQLESSQGKQEIPLPLNNSSILVGSSNNALSVTAFEQIPPNEVPIPGHFKNYVEAYCSNISPEYAFSLYQQGEEVKKAIFSEELKEISSEDELREKIIPLIWFLMCSKQLFHQGSLNIVDPSHRLADVLLSCPGIGKRMSSHKVSPQIKEQQQYGLDLFPSGEDRLPADKRTLLLESYFSENQWFLFIKPEDKGVHTIGDAFLHGWDYLKIQTQRQLAQQIPFVFNSPDEGEGVCKERLSPELQNIFEQIRTTLGDMPLLTYASEKRVSAMIVDLALWLESNIKHENFEKALSPISNFIQYIRNKGWDHLDKRIGNEVIIGESSLLGLPKCPQPKYLEYLEALVEIRQAKNVKELSEVLNRSDILKSTPPIRRDSYFEGIKFESRTGLFRLVQRDFLPLLQNPLFTLDEKKVSDLVDPSSLTSFEEDPLFTLIRTEECTPKATTDEAIKQTVSFIRHLKKALPRATDEQIEKMLNFIHQNAQMKLMEYLNNCTRENLYSKGFEAHLLQKVGGDKPSRVAIWTTPQPGIEISKKFVLSDEGGNTMSQLEGRVRVVFDENFDPFVQWSWGVTGTYPISSK